MKILKELYYGNLDPSDGGRPSGAEYRRYQLAREQARSGLEKGLDEKQRAMLQEFAEQSLWMAGLENERAFSDGFCLGVRLMAAIYEAPMGGGE